MILRVYLDTSVIGGCFDQEFLPWSMKLFAELRNKKKIAVISDLTFRELNNAPQRVRELLNELPKTALEIVQFDIKAEKLAHAYIQNKAAHLKHIVDAQHIAIATVSEVDVLVSWNFKQIVNLNKIHMFNSVNLKLGYPMLEIRSPREVFNEEEI